MPACWWSCWRKSRQRRRLKWSAAMALALPKAARAAIAQCATVAVIPLVEGAVHWPASQAGAQELNEAIEPMARTGQQDWKDESSYLLPLPGVWMCKIRKSL